jgi:hypothetical protein
MRKRLRVSAPAACTFAVIAASVALTSHYADLPEVASNALSSLALSLWKRSSQGDFGPGPGTYLILQVLVLAVSPGWWRVVMAMPLLIMMPIWGDTYTNSSSNLWWIAVVMASQLMVYLMFFGLFIAGWIRIQRRNKR